MLTLDGELRKTRLFRPHQQAELVGALADTRRDARTEAAVQNGIDRYPTDD